MTNPCLSMGGGGDGPCDFSVSPRSKYCFFLLWGDFYLTWGPVGTRAWTWTRAWQLRNLHVGARNPDCLPGSDSSACELLAAINHNVALDTIWPPALGPPGHCSLTQEDNRGNKTKCSFHFVSLYWQPKSDWHSLLKSYQKLTLSLSLQVEIMILIFSANPNRLIGIGVDKKS